MIVTGLKQGTAEWLEWRRRHVTASDIPVLMGESDFSTPREAWKIKTGRAKEQESNFAMQRGIETEPKIRALYALENDVDVPPALVEHDVISVFGASLDGFNPEKSLVAEIKYPGKDKHQQAIDGIVPECYRAQVQFQLECAGAKHCDYISYSEPAIAVVRVGRDEEHIGRIIPVAAQFWEYVKRDVAPPLTDRDFLEVDEHDSALLFEEWKRLRLIQMQMEELPDAKSDLKRITGQLEAIREKIKTVMVHPKILCNGVKATFAKRKTGMTLTLNFKEA